ncbi:hypothetical protein AVEN_80824-1 [Araneus ventricosus]|uniref:DNA-directed DNA polymerase n=1 Tax=Araneus ventricosus TaxID=182803 RepID=A0A4Y2NX54_ARAVE|nr:hypothetical protein AVEN_80824-1 [Araneus ventricosus]
MPNFDSSNPSKYIMDYDANNLYGWAMSQALPLENFQWESPELWDEERILQIPDERETGFIFEVDLEYPKEIHDTHNCLPVAAEKLKTDKSMLSPYQLNLVDKLGYKTTESITKLMPNLNNKTKYVAHFRNLKLYKEFRIKNYMRACCTQF